MKRPSCQPLAAEWLTRGGLNDNFAAMNEPLSSLRMRAERDGKHISGAERLVPFEQLQDVTIEMVQRALRHTRGQAEQINISVEPIDKADLQFGRLPDLHNNTVQSWQQGRELAAGMLASYGVAQQAVDQAMESLASGAASNGQSMRGAMLIDADSGERLESDPDRGVRVSRMDLSSAAREQLQVQLAAQGLANDHVVEALILAAKVVSAPTLIAELCWSDDPDYLAGYVASSAGGYQRINVLKPFGEERGGRAFFIRCSKDQLGALVNWLERQPFLIERIGRVHPPRQWKDEA